MALYGYIYIGMTDHQRILFDQATFLMGTTTRQLKNSHGIYLASQTFQKKTGNVCGRNGHQMHGVYPSKFICDCPVCARKHDGSLFFDEKNSTVNFLS